MDKEKLLPSLRFSGFTDAWEQRRLESLCDLFTDGDWIESKDQSNSGVRLVQTGNVGTTEYLNKENNQKWISEETFNRLHCEEIFSGDILISRLPEPAGRACIMPDLGVRMITAVDCTIVRTSDECDSKYLVQYLSTPEYFKVVNSFLGGGTRQRISRANLAEISVPLPMKKEEQKKIGSFFANLDSLITLHQHKLGKIKDLKKMMLSKMFPKNGNKVPEVRFSEFDGAWEYRKLGTISDKITEKNGYMEFAEILTNSAEYGIIRQRDFFDHDIAKQDKINGYYVVRPEDFVYNPRISTTAPVGPIGRNKLGRCGVISPLYTVFRPKEVDNSFLEQFFKSSHWYSFMRFNGDTGARSDRFSIKDATFFEMPIPFPKLDEQRRIGQYLAGLDVLISLQDKKLTKLKNIKAGCLEKMFV